MPIPVNSRTNALPAVALALLATAAHAQDASPSSLFAAEAARICVDTRADPAAVRQLAAAENWTAIDPASVPVKASIVLEGRKKSERRSFSRTHAWTFEKDGLSATVGLFDFPEEPRAKQCQLIAWDIDFAVAAAAFHADTRFQGGFDQGIPIRNYSVAGAGMTVSYLKSDAGTKAIHVMTANPLK